MQERSSIIADRDDDTASVDENIADTQELAYKNPAAVALGRLGGLKGGKARAESLSDGRRSEIAKHAARARWDKRP